MDFSTQAPTLWTLDLGCVVQVGEVPTGAVTVRHGREGSGPHAQLAGFGGPALALCAWESAPDPRLALAVGRAVRAGQATASRASLIARSPLSGRLTQAQVGTDLARRLARLCDGLLLCGQTRVPDAVLVLDAQGAMRIESFPGMRAMDTTRSAAQLEAQLGAGAVLRAGPAAHRGVLWSNLCAGQDPPSFVGSGGMGAVLAGTGLAAIVVLAEPVPQAEHGDSWLESLMRSPRLIARAQGQALQGAQVRPLAETARERHGCSGCPTPCGFVFERPDHRKGHARFTALKPLMEMVGDADGEGLTALLSACNDWGVDAREAAACLWLDLQHGEPCDLDPVQRLQALCRGERGPQEFGQGSKALAAAYGARPSEDSKGPMPTPIQRLARNFGVRGDEPLRSYPFLVDQWIDGERMRELVAPLELPPGSEASELAAGKGRLLWWHENLIAGVDGIGVCAFTVASLLSDGVSDLAGLAERILPAGWEGEDAGQVLLEFGAGYLALFMELDARGSEIPEAHSELPAELMAEAREYLALRGAGTHRNEAAVRAFPGADVPPFPGSGPVDSRAAIQVELRFLGALGQRFGTAMHLRLAAPATLAQAMEELAQERAREAHWLVREGRPVPAVLRSGEVLAAGSLLRDGDVLELLLAISGG
ncbi:MAG: hypothetical protein KDB61_00420 [Planctomycetes bacterium]|nr:hypothetical protein [Planctomycetota bacterium]